VAAGLGGSVSELLALGQGAGGFQPAVLPDQADNHEDEGDGEEENRDAEEPPNPPGVNFDALGVESPGRLVSHGVGDEEENGHDEEPKPDSLDGMHTERGVGSTNHF